MLASVEKGEFDLVLMDLNYTARHHFRKRRSDLLVAAAQLDGKLSVVVMTAWGSVDGAVEAMRRGARDYVQKPWDNDAAARACCGPQVELGRALRTSQRLEDENQRLRGERVPQLIAESRGDAAGARA